jgi:glycosyltransferase involved in cell wall biosynthesis
LSQSFADFELLLVDNASTDATESIGREFAAADGRVRYFRNPQNLGAAPNFNRAYEVSRAPLVRWASHDDFWAPDAMQVCIERLDRDPSAVACHGQTVVVDEAGTPIPTAPPGAPAPAGQVAFARLYDPPSRRLADVLARNRLSDLLLHTHWCYEIFAVFRRSAVARTGLHRSFYGSDKVLLAELLMQGPILNVERPVFYRRDHVDNSTSLRTHADRADWIDTSLQGRLRRPHLSLLKGYFNAIRRANQPMTEKAACFRALAAWALQVRKLRTVVLESDSASVGPVPVSAGSDNHTDRHASDARRPAPAE